MFGKKYITIKESVPYAQSINKVVTENKAPTDESIRLLNEFQEEAKKNLLRTIPIKDNIITGSIQMYKAIETNKNEIRIRIIINGKELLIKDNIDCETAVLSGKPPVEVITDKIIKGISAEIARHLKLNIPEGSF